MNDNELESRLKARGFSLGAPIMDESGTMLFRVNNVCMYRMDAMDIANGDATLQGVVVRNKGKIFPGARGE